MSRQETRAPDGDCGCAHLAATDPPELPALRADSQLVGWSGVICAEQVMAGDGNIIERNALRWDNLPIPLRLVVEDFGAHDGAVSVGRITHIERDRDGLIRASGDIDVSSTAGADAARMISGQIQSGISVDLDDVSFEVRVAADLVVDDDETVEVPAPDSDGRITVMKIDSDSEIVVTTSARIRSATLVAIPAFVEARIVLNENMAVEASDVPAVAASGVPPAPPAEWFDDPDLSGPTPFTITDDGHVYGHLALWDTCHLSFTMQGQCVTPPRSGTGYAHYRLGSTRTSNGGEVATGTITMNSRHAVAAAGAVAAMAHYEDTGLAAADVACGEDAWGIWVAGALRPGLSDATVRALRAAPLSGDWRRVSTSGGLELVAALAVNTPGFPVPRAAGLVAAGRMMSLVAAGTVTERDIAAARPAAWLAPEDARALARLAAKQRATERARVDEMATQIRHDGAVKLLARVAATTRKG